MNRSTLCRTILKFACLLVISRAAAADYPNDRSPLAINLGGITYYTSEVVFVDLFKHSQTFKS
ncbi:MAG TPA: hypothetical protein ENN81_01640, partial [Phycisphaerales bacterium]|nr:hypothetical protein [Phycisphaerales bacterium]